MSRGAAPGERRGGRQKGTPNKRVAEAVAAVAEAFPEWTPLLHLAKVANDEAADPELRLDAVKAAAGYFHARPKAVEMDPDAIVDLERRIQEVRSDAQMASFSKNPHLANLADRLERAAQRASDVDFELRVRAVEDRAALQPASHALLVEEIETPTLGEAANADLAARLERAAVRSAAPPPEPEPYRPITRAPKPRPFGGKASS